MRTEIKYIFLGWTAYLETDSWNYFSNYKWSYIKVQRSTFCGYKVSDHCLFLFSIISGSQYISLPYDYIRICEVYILHSAKWHNFKHSKLSHLKGTLPIIYMYIYIFIYKQQCHICINAKYQVTIVILLTEAATNLVKFQLTPHPHFTHDKVTSRIINGHINISPTYGFWWTRHTAPLTGRWITAVLTTTYEGAGQLVICNRKPCIAYSDKKIGQMRRRSTTVCKKYLRNDFSSLKENAIEESTLWQEQGA